MRLFRLDGYSVRFFCDMVDMLNRIGQGTYFCCDYYSTIQPKKKASPAKEATVSKKPEKVQKDLSQLSKKEKLKVCVFIS